MENDLALPGSHSYSVWFVGETVEVAVKGTPYDSQAEAEGVADAKGGLPIWQSTMTVTFTGLVLVLGQRTEEGSRA